MYGVRASILASVHGIRPAVEDGRALSPLCIGEFSQGNSRYKAGKTAELKDGNLMRTGPSSRMEKARSSSQAAYYQGKVLGISKWGANFPTRMSRGLTLSVRSRSNCHMHWCHRWAIVPQRSRSQMMPYTAEKMNHKRAKVLGPGSGRSLQNMAVR